MRFSNKWRWNMIISIFLKGRLILRGKCHRLSIWNRIFFNSWPGIDIPVLMMFIVNIVGKRRKYRLRCAFWRCCIWLTKMIWCLSPPMQRRILWSGCRIVECLFCLFWFILLCFLIFQNSYNFHHYIYKIDFT